MLHRIKDELMNGIIPFWTSLHDSEHGGFYGYMDYDLNVDKKAEKGCILNSRIMWFFSRAYVELGNESLLREAKHAYDFLKNYCIDETYGGIYWSLTYDGKIFDNTKHTYNQAFAIYALAEYYEASKDEEALRMALEIFEIIESKCRDEEGYCEAFTREFNPVANHKLSENGVIAERTMNTALHVIEAYTQLYKVTAGIEEHELVGQKLAALLNIVRSKIYNADKRRQEVFFDGKYRSLLDLHSYGHDIEASWLIDRAVEVLGENALTKEALDDIKKITLEMAAETYEKAFTGRYFVNECENGVVDETGIWWVQAEAMVGFVNAFMKTEDTRYFKGAETLWDFVEESLIDKREGSEWFWEVSPDGTPSKKPIVEPWKCPYHNGRMCFELMKILG
ncbi:MAG: AGE family epimerase/isomerase [Butyrivibrio sp.]|nr:AGE family epimerase/isomerase [Butyrivibrio sp.]